MLQSHAKYEDSVYNRKRGSKAGILSEWFNVKSFTNGSIYNNYIYYIKSLFAAASGYYLHELRRNEAMLETTVQNTDQETSAAQGKSRPDVLDQLLKPEVQESLTVLVDQLPKLTEMMTLLTKTYDLAQKVANDRVLIQDMVGGIQEVVKPLEEKVKGYASAVIEANDRAEQSEETIGLFGMLRLLKDPELQKMLRFAQAYLDIMGERNRKHQD